jgi:hypothetical protein
LGSPSLLLLFFTIFLSSFATAGPIHPVDGVL